MECKSLYIKTFGCQMNERDSEIIAHLLSSLGYVCTDDWEEADLVVLNTCSIRDKAEQKVYSYLGQIRAKRPANGPMIVVAGCVAQQQGKEIFRRMPHVDIVVGTQQLYNLPAMVLEVEGKKISRYLADKLETNFTIPTYKQIFAPQSSAMAGNDPSALPSSTSLHKKFVTIMQGCNNYCSYCVVPYTRGRETSREISDILDEVRSLVRQGVREITLLGQNVNSYGKTLKSGNRNPTFAQLLYQVAEVKGLTRLRFTTSNPHDLSDDLIDCFRNIDKLCSHFHLPVQSGSDAVLAKMRRRYTVSEYLDRVDRLREARPGIAISTDIIVGFPGESDEDFEATMQLLETVRFHASFSFKYSDRPGTLSASFDNKVEEKIKSERLSRFQQRQDEITFKHNNSYLGKEIEIMLEESGPRSFGRTGTNHLVHLEENLDPSCYAAGDCLTARITRAGKHSLTGTTTSPDKAM